MGSDDAPIEHKARGYKAAISNPHVSGPAKAHAQQELDRYDLEKTLGEGEKPVENVKSGLKAALSNPNNTEMGKMKARQKLESMGEEPEQPVD
ncbi:hypothetical protein ASPZODRAFT_11496 [Penicilliopsis zonata CBS 506.65]|uniref:Conidiation protein 6 n=1 Tax=Penicilliopsis zonata CBS 506.65 TaxID=1073090 RepID=A0A1L9STU7_9EURO|nr:hypothetical protein ASPZODRAFT_11496 [Penicilliopsis zonata CBS 506.65]OJJ50632.1 hypothetical protein ASPZODRAFT_11496 [Penicilliopsis zonata CBS 506.65]